MNIVLLRIRDGIAGPTQIKCLLHAFHSSHKTPFQFFGQLDIFHRTVQTSQLFFRRTMEKVVAVEIMEHLPQHFQLVLDNCDRLFYALKLFTLKIRVLFQGEVHVFLDADVINDQALFLTAAAILFALAELLIPELARCAAVGSTRRIRYLTRRSLRMAMLYGLCCGGLLFLLAAPLGETLYHSEEAGRYLMLFALLSPMLYCDALIDAMTKGLGQQTYCVRYNIITSALDLLLLYILLPRYGMYGYFLSFFATHLLNFALSIRGGCGRRAAPAALFPAA